MSGYCQESCTYGRPREMIPGFGTTSVSRMHSKDKHCHVLRDTIAWVRKVICEKIRHCLKLSYVKTRNPGMDHNVASVSPMASPANQLSPPKSRSAATPKETQHRF